MKRLAILLVPIVLAACTGIPGLPGSGDTQPSDTTSEPTPSPDYFPLIEGATWTLKGYNYSHRTGTGTPFGSMVFKITSVETLGEQATASMRITQLDSDGKEKSISNGLYVKEPGGVYTVNVDGSNRQAFIPWPLKAGTEIVEEATASSVATNSAVVRETAANKAIVSDFGRLEGCYEVTRTGSSLYKSFSYSSDSTTSIKVILAPNIGLVGMSTENESKNSENLYTVYTRTDYEIATYSIPVKK